MKNALLGILSVIVHGIIGLGIWKGPELIDIFREDSAPQDAPAERTAEQEAAGAAHQLLSELAIAQEAAYTAINRYADNVEELVWSSYADDAGNNVESGVTIDVPEGVRFDMVLDQANEEWAAVAVTAGGRVFVRTSMSSEILEYGSLDGDLVPATQNGDKDREARFGAKPHPVEVEKPFYVLSGTLDDPKIELR